MGKRRYYVKSQIEDFAVKYDVERKCPLGWYTEVEADNTSIDVIFWYVPHNKVDDRPLKKHDKRFTFKKEDILKIIPDEILENKFQLCMYASKMGRKSNEVEQNIRKALADDFKELQSTTKSTAEMYSTVLKEFGEEAKYQHLLNVLAKHIALGFVFSRLMPSGSGVFNYYEL